jgi:tRNA A-37 threonylcarbamoyl transferase component Bud32
MPTRPHVRRRAASGTATGVASGTAGGRAFFQERLTVWAKVGFLIVVGFLVLGELVAFLGFQTVRPPVARDLHFALGILWGGAWLALRRWTLPRAALGAVDAVLVLVGCPIALLFTVLDDPIQSFTYLPALLVFLGSVGRALFIPSSGGRTLVVSLGIAVAVHGAAAPFDTGREIPELAPFAPLGIWSLAWSACAVALAAVASRVIYGLRREIRKALQLGQYTLEEKLGEGGMGTVYRARHAMLRRPTAVKLLPPEKVGASSLERFEREVQLTALLSHPNTVAIFDYGRTPDGIFYYAMEYLDGIDLESLVLEHGPQPAERVVHVLQQVCGSLGEAHERGLIHRDVKPANIILCERGGALDVAKVVDFGLVKDLEQASGITQADTLTGTPLYLAPESIRGEDVDGRADLYALGAVGYYLLVGRNVFEGRTLVEVCGHHLHARPQPPSERLGHSVPPKLEAVILSCLEKDPQSRPGSARHLARALASCDVSAWGDDQARAWWREHGRRERAPGDGLRGATHGTLTPSLEPRGSTPHGDGTAWTV